MWDGRTRHKKLATQISDCWRVINRKNFEQRSVVGRWRWRRWMDTARVIKITCLWVAESIVGDIIEALLVRLRTGAIWMGKLRRDLWELFNDFSGYSQSLLHHLWRFISWRSVINSSSQHQHWPQQARDSDQPQNAITKFQLFATCFAQHSCTNRARDEPAETSSVY